LPQPELTGKTQKQKFYTSAFSRKSCRFKQAFTLFKIVIAHWRQAREIMKNNYFPENAGRSLIGAIVLALIALSISCSVSADKNYNSLIRRAGAESVDTNASPNPNAVTGANANEKTPASPAENNSPNTEPVKTQSYRDNLPAGFLFPADAVGERILSEYGALYVAKGGVAPLKVMFANESECSGWQSGLNTSRVSIGGFSLELQSPAMKSLQEAIAEAQSAGESITPRGADSARRSYSQTVELWASRVDPALAHWVAKGRLTQQDADRIKSLSPTEQVAEVLRLEERGIFFSKDLSKSILYSVAAPGTSQHLSMLALDVEQFASPNVREILARHGWFQTVISDLPHFTYLGLKETELPAKGLKPVLFNGQKFWIPNLTAKIDKNR
jgi:hypothetical protein